MSLSHLSVAPYGEDQPDTESTSETVDPQQQVLTLKKKLEEAVGEVVRLQSGIAAQEELQRLLKQGRALLQDLRLRMEEVSGERDRLKSEVDDMKAQLEQTESERDRLDTERRHLQRQLEEATDKQREMTEDLDEHRRRIESLRGAAVRAQALAREIVETHDTARV
jgi:chromosome segregation ATPase